jgi:hypothetical protein
MTIAEIKILLILNHSLCHELPENSANEDGTQENQIHCVKLQLK